MTATDAEKNAQLAKLVGMHTDMQSDLAAMHEDHQAQRVALHQQHVDAIKAEAGIYLAMGVDPANLNPILVSIMS